LLAAFQQLSILGKPEHSSGFILLTVGGF